MSKIVSWITTPISLLLLVVTLVIWHPMLVILHRIHLGLFYRLVAIGNWVLIQSLKASGTRVRVSGYHQIKHLKNILIVSNHQSYFDIPLFIWIFRQFRPSFVAKHTLGRFFPSVSFVLRVSGSALINRKVPREALPAIERMASIASREGRSVCIFPEGTRAKDGTVKRFKQAGLIKLLESVPTYTVIPVHLSGAWKLMRYGMLPIPFGVSVEISILEPISRDKLSNEDVAKACEDKITNFSKNLTTTI